MDRTRVEERKKVSPCADFKFQGLCSGYSSLLPCCNSIDSQAKRFKERAKILWGRSDCVDLFRLKHELLESKLFKFRAVSRCMFPVLKKGDILKITPVRIEDIKIGDIPVYRKGNRLYSHRVVGKKLIGEKEYILTRADTSESRAPAAGAEAEKVCGEEILGKISVIRRGRKTFSTQKKKVTAGEKFLFKWDKMYAKNMKIFRKARDNSLAKIQSLRLYSWVGKIIVKKLEPGINFQLLIPAKSKLEIYEYYPLEKNDVSNLKDYENFHILMKVREVPIGCVTFSNKTKHCPQGGFWLSDIYIRSRYRAIGFESILVNRAQEFLKNWR